MIHFMIRFLNRFIDGVEQRHRRGHHWVAGIRDEEANPPTQEKLWPCPVCRGKGVLDAGDVCPECHGAGTIKD